MSLIHTRIARACDMLKSLDTITVTSISDRIKTIINLYGAVIMLGYAYVDACDRFKRVVLGKTVELYYDSTATDELKFILDDFFCKITGNCITSYMFVDGILGIPNIPSYFILEYTFHTGAMYITSSVIPSAMTVHTKFALVMAELLEQE
jgi:hypothetical protein